MNGILNAAVGVGFLGLLIASVAPESSVTRLVGPSAVLLDEAQGETGLALKPALALGQSSAWEARTMLARNNASAAPCLPDVSVGDRITMSAGGGKSQELLVTRRDDGTPVPQTGGRRGPVTVECWMTDAASGALIRVLIQAKPQPRHLRTPQQKL